NHVAAWLAPTPHHDRITTGIWDQRNVAKRPVCNAAISSRSCPLGSGLTESTHPGHVHSSPDSDRDSDLPDGREVPLATKVQRSNLDNLFGANRPPPTTAHRTPQP